MAFQGLDLVTREQNKRLKIAGVVLDSCPGEDSTPLQVNF
jgi:hypothetical protein